MSLSDKDIKTWDARLKDQNDRGWENYLHRRILLDVAADLQDWAISGEFIHVERSSSAAAVASIRLNRNTNDALDFELGTVIKTIFIEVFITHTALAGEWLDVVWGINFEYYKQIASPLTVVDGGGSLSVDDGGGSLTVDGVFWQATQPVSAAALPLPAGAATSALQTQPGVDVGDVTVNNAVGAAAVNVQDGGNSLTVDGSVTAVDNGIAQPCIIITNAAADANTVGANHACKRVLVRAHTINTGLVWVDFQTAAVALACYPLAAGDSVSVPLTNTNLVNCLFKVANEKVTVVYTN